MRQLKTRDLIRYGSMVLPVALMRKNEGEKFSPLADNTWVNGRCSWHQNYTDKGRRV